MKKNNLLPKVLCYQLASLIDAYHQARLKRAKRRELKLGLEQLATKPRIIVGAGGTQFAGWVTTDQDVLNLLFKSDWSSYFKPNTIVAILAEHVWEHLEVDDAKRAAENCYIFLKSGGNLRVAVPDGYFPDADYIERVRPMGSGPGSEDHKVLYNYRTLSRIFISVGFNVALLEYWDEDGQFHYLPWDMNDGFVHRSRDHDSRNKGGTLKYTSLIIDAKKP